MTGNLSRRTVLKAVAATPFTFSLGNAARSQEATPKAPTTCVFSKHLQFLDYRELAETCRDIGVDGVDLTVRPGGHVLPKNVKRDLPAAVEAIRDAGLQLSMITTNLISGDDPTAQPILTTASELGIKYFRVGGLRYDGVRSPAEQLPGFVEDLRSLAQLAAELNMVAAYHNHSGANQVGGPLWDLHHLLEKVDSPHLGSNFDPGHAMVEGAGGAWLANTLLMAPWVETMSVKDFGWRGDRPRWSPLGEGIVPLEEMLRLLRAEGFAGPISIHVEYKVDSHQAMIETIARDAAEVGKLIAATA